MSWSFVAEQIARAMTRETLRAEVAGVFVNFRLADQPDKIA